MAQFSTSLVGEAKTLLLATDGSNFSEGAVQEAIFFGQSCHAKVIVLHVVNSEAESLRASTSALRQGRQDMSPHLDFIRRMAADSGVDIELVVIGSSRPEQTIVEQARLRGADLILMGRHGKAKRLSLLVGKMTSKVLAQGFPKVLVAPKDFIISGQHVLLAVDGSPNSNLAAAEALNLERSCTTLLRMTVMSVARREDERDKAQALVDAVCAQGKAADFPLTCESLVAVGEPADQIVTAAMERDVDMIIIGGLGKSGMAKLLKGHVTENVIGKSHCAVLVVTAASAAS